jgi:Na+:H+ antiporter, NhaA family
MMAQSPNQASSDIAASFVLLAATLLALVLANSAFYGTYSDTLATKIAVTANGVGVEDSLKNWIKNALMAVFFLYVGLEIKAEFTEGALSTRRKAVLPFLAAAGGMAGPAIIYLLIVSFDPALSRGWAIPSATDIAFAVGVVGLLGSRVSSSLKAFLLAVAVIDDLGAIIIIALFYTVELFTGPLIYASICLAILLTLNLRGVGSIAPYLFVGAALWYFVLQSGINPTLAGVVTALFIPLKSDNAHPLHDLVMALKGTVLFLIMPVFALANAGVPFVGITFFDLAQPVTSGIALGLLFGKPIGIMLMVWLAVASGLAERPEGASWMQISGIACLAGIGFTMSLFIGALAFPGEAQMNAVRLGVLSGSLVSALLGVAILSIGTARHKPAAASA